MMTNINETVESYFEGCVGVGVFDCFVHPPSLHPNPNHPQKQLAKELRSLLMFPNWLALEM